MTEDDHVHVCPGCGYETGEAPDEDDPEYQVAVEFCKQLFLALRPDGGVWGIPRSGMVYMRVGPMELALTARMPHNKSMPCGAAELAEQQRDEYIAVKRYMGVSGITVTDRTGVV